MASLDEQFVLPLTEFEVRFDVVRLHQRISGVWWWCFVFSAAYVVLVFSGQRLMRDRQPFSLRLPLILWNTELAVFSILAALRSIEVKSMEVRQEGFLRSVCDEANTRPVSGLWAAAFVMSKVIEFGDTAFLVLRKRPLIFLHYYHHVVTCIYCWYSYAYLLGPGGWFGAINYNVHAVMYSYYAVRAAGYRLPKGLSMAITTLQIAQMVAGMFVSGVAHVAHRAGEDCNWSDFDSLITAAMYGSYFVLFLNYFFKSYFSKSPKGKKD